MTTVADLRVGDVLQLPGHDRPGVFLGRSEHPVWLRLQAVTWLMNDGEWFVDAMEPDRDVGDVIDRVELTDLCRRLTNRLPV